MHQRGVHVAQLDDNEGSITVFLLLKHLASMQDFWRIHTFGGHYTHLAPNLLAPWRVSALDHAGSNCSPAFSSRIHLPNTKPGTRSLCKSAVGLCQAASMFFKDPTSSHEASNFSTQEKSEKITRSFLTGHLAIELDVFAAFSYHKPAEFIAIFKEFPMSKGFPEQLGSSSLKWLGGFNSSDSMDPCLSLGINHQ